MTAPTGETTPAAPTTTATPATPETAPQTPPAAPVDATTAPAGKAPTFDGDFDPKRASALIEKLRGEVGELKQGKTAAEKAAEDRVSAMEKRFADQTSALAKALGIAPQDEAPKPEAIAQQAVKEVESVQGQLRALLLERAVDRAAAEHKADPVALGDSRTFQAAVAALDPKAPNYGAQVAAAVKAATETNPRLLVPEPAPAAPAEAPAEKPKPGVSGGEIKAGSTTGPITQAQLQAMFDEGKHDEIDKLMREGKLSHLT